MSHARVEELSDSDPDIDDPSDFLPHSDEHIIRPAAASHSSQTHPSPSSSSLGTNPTLFRPPPAPTPQIRPQTREEIKRFQTLYPVYFDSTRSKKQGRRVSSQLAIPNPLAWQVLCAVRFAVGENVFRMAFEPEKTHPKDWANPGRVKLLLKDPDTHAPLNSQIRSKAHLYTIIGKWLKENPTTKEAPLELRLQGLPIPENFLQTEVAVPRGWKMGTILPVHSSAVSGGGVRDDFFKEAMEELRHAQSQGHLPAGGPGGGGGGGGGGMPDINALQSMMNGMGGMGGLGGMMGGGGGGGGGESSGKKKKDKKKT
ncbi:signal recognition particle subunit SRP19 [Cladophialophora psammophila CBS 110553]|uniref:Signal recognition particle subunit SRP19 n=1 Tax=Cladophialophora psammophila CBS 110553 TaxID=1182543 RepID=W9WE67_9EURO|nr:signal recognition particle subunit SRP19 [Cladophialophora psammophila CBS 110553]EXJ66387.1 signal recognition particle subunit SRP19 [Cladophialophora psammophila CBS 110553]